MYFLSASGDNFGRHLPYVTWELVQSVNQCPSDIHPSRRWIYPKDSRWASFTLSADRVPIPQPRSCWLNPWLNTLVIWLQLTTCLKWLTFRSTVRSPASWKRITGHARNIHGECSTAPRPTFCQVHRKSCRNAARSSIISYCDAGTNRVLTRYIEPSRYRNPESLPLQLGRKECHYLDTGQFVVLLPEYGN